MSAADRPRPAVDLEELLAEALAQFDAGGDAALAAFVQSHPAQATALERGIRRCREMGLLGSGSVDRAAAGGEHPERLGEFQLLRRIGGGGMGVVYEAVQEPLGRRVALKVIRPELLFFEGARERFRREVDAIARLQHPSIVSVFSAGEHEGVPFFTMEMVDGITVEQACAALRARDPASLRGADLRGTLAAADAGGDLFAGALWEVAVRIALQVALGLRHAHVRGIVHRDIKPSNVMVTPHGRVVVLDFGVAQTRSGHDLTRSGATPGSPAFMSPEQRRGAATDERTDVFSLAATVWQLLTLQRPFRLEHGRVGEALPALRSLQRAAPRELDLVLRTAMDPDRERRYGDMAAFATDLQAVLERRPIQARPPGAVLRLVRWSQRHRTAATAIAVALGAGAVMLVVLLVVQRASQQALAAEQMRTRRSLDTSLEALESILVRLGNDQLRAVPQAERIAHGALEDAAALYRGLFAHHGDDEQVRRLGGRALHALAMSCDRQGEAVQALALLDEALAVLGHDAPGSPSLLDIRAHAWMTRGSFLSGGPDRAGALAAIERAEADFAAAAAGAPGLLAESLRARSELCTSRSLLHDEATEPARVEAELQRALALQRECMALGRPDAKDPALVVMRLTNLGRFLERQARLDDARPVLDEALGLARELPTRGTWPPPAVYVAELQDAIGSVLLKQKDPAAEGWLRDAIAARQQAVDQFPTNLEFRIRLAGTMHNYGRHVYAAGDRTAEALEWFEAARAQQREALLKAPTNPIALDFMAKHVEMVGFCHAVLRDGEPVAAAARELAALPLPRPHVALRAADFFLRAWHLLGKGDETLRDQAMAQLLVAEQRGLTAAQLPTRGFEALRERPEYVAWRDRVAQVTAPAGR
jgi:serine/threonine protein kinase